MPFEQDRIHYYSKTEPSVLIGVSRQTLYRWIEDGRVQAPLYARTRDGRLFYSESEVESLRAFANGVERIKDIAANQLHLFRNAPPGLAT